MRLIGQEVKNYVLDMVIDAQTDMRKNLYLPTLASGRSGAKISIDIMLQGLRLTPPPHVIDDTTSL